MQQKDLTFFDLSPISMWLQDFSGVKKIFDRWKSEGIQDLEAFLLEDTNRLYECLATIHTLHVNKSTLRLYEAKDLDEILAHFMKFLTPEVTEFQIKFFCALWNDNAHCAIPVVNYTCKGKQIDVQLSATIVTGYEDSWELLMLTTEEISAYQNARRFAESIFMHSPTALWVKDYSAIKSSFNELKLQGVKKLDVYMTEQPQYIQQCFKMIKSISVNQSLLKLFKAQDKSQFDQQLEQLFAQNNYQNFYFQLLHLWDKHPVLERECEYQLNDDSIICVLEQLNVFPDAQDSWNTIQVAFTNLTERKALETYLHYLSKYDQLTQLHNRTFFNEEIKRLKEQAVAPIACIYMDVNGLKQINDIQGHHHGDLLLKSFANLLIDATQSKNCSVSRIGGDEFVILMPNATEQDAQTLMQEIENLIVLRTNEHPRISVATGVASTDHHQNLENIIKIADANMYRKKRNHYEMIAT